MESRIPIKDAKDELVKINELLENPKLLIGGLAVNQYFPARNSSDIDLVVEYEIANALIEKLYPTINWKISDKNDDEIRPSYHIQNLSNPDLIIKFGPKILQREPYEFMDWGILKNKAQNFKYLKNQLKNIIIPSVTDLSFTKLISYISRKDKNPEKATQDLIDFVNLSNHESWSSIDFYTIIDKSSSYNYLQNSLNFGAEDKELLERSSLIQILNLFRKPTHKISEIPRDDKLLEKRINKTIEYARDFISTNPNKTIGVIGIDLLGFTAINMKYGNEIGNLIIKIVGDLIKKAKFSNTFKYQAIGDTFVILFVLEKGQNIKKVGTQFHELVSSHNWKEIEENLYVNSYTNYGLKKEQEEPHMLVKRVLDSLLTQKENGRVFMPLMNEIQRIDMDINYMAS